MMYIDKLAIRYVTGMGGGVGVLLLFTKEASGLSSPLWAGLLIAGTVMFFIGTHVVLPPKK
jgi:hypothetical protein